MAHNMTPKDEPLQNDRLDAQLDALAHSGDEPANTPTSRAYQRLSQLYAPAAAEEAQAIERVRQRLVARATAPAAPKASYQHAPALQDTDFVPLPAQPLPVHPTPPHRSSPVRTFIRGLAAVLVVGALVGGFAVVRQMGSGSAPFTGYQWQIVPSPNTTLAVNTLTGITVRSSSDAWAWGTANDAPSNENSNPITQPLVEHWDGQHWRIIATPPLQEGGMLADLVALAPNDAWAVGAQTTGGSENTSGAPVIEHWNGHQWTIVPDNVSNWPDPSGLAKLAALSADDIWAVGSAGSGSNSGLIQHWDGHNWQTIAHPEPSSGVQFSAIAAVAANDIWVVGALEQQAGVGAPVFEHWDGRSWSIVPSPSPGGIGPLRDHMTVTAMSAVSANDVWAAGFVNHAIPIPNASDLLFEHWDGHRWSIVNGPSVDATVADIVALGPDDVWAVGTTTGPGLDVAQQGQGLVEHWDGQTWSLISNPSPHPFTALNGVTRDPSVSGKVWVAGTTGPVRTPDQLTDTKTLIETTQ